MVSIEEIADSQEADSLRNHISSFSQPEMYDRFYDMNGHLVSNDSMVGALASLEEVKIEPGIGLFIGAAGINSILPIARGALLPVNIDRNPAVLDFNQQLNHVITTRDEELSQQPGQREVCDTAADALAPNDPNMYQLTRRLLYMEAGLQGAKHWSKPENVHMAAEALRNAPPIRVATSLQSPDFQSGLSQANTQTGVEITFLNLTNVHEWAGDMSWLEGKLPIADGATVMYSQSSERGFTSRIVRGLDAYIRATKGAVRLG